MSNQEHNKYKYWVCTIMSNEEHPLVDGFQLESTFKTLCSEYTFQLEQGSTGMMHYQCAVASKIRKRQLTLLNDIQELLQFPKHLIQLDRSFDYETAKLYCSAIEKRVEGTSVLTNLKQPVTYTQEDIKLLDDKENRYPWQDDFMSQFFTEDETDYLPCSGRTIYWIYDPYGNSGKSVFTKWLRMRYDNNTKIGFGSATQLRTAIVVKPPQKMYIIDIPRTLSSDDSMATLYSVAEELLNGYVTTSMHGDPRETIFDPPFVVVFSNRPPEQDKLSMDRWNIQLITFGKQLESL